jgi:hypothetical protein
MCGTPLHRILTLVPSPPAQQLPAQEDNLSPAEHIPMNAQEKLTSRTTPSSNTTDGVPPRKALHPSVTELEEVNQEVSVRTADTNEGVRNSFKRS